MYVECLKIFCLVHSVDKIIQENTWAIHQFCCFVFCVYMLHIWSYFISLNTLSQVVSLGYFRLEERRSSSTFWNVCLYISSLTCGCERSVNRPSCCLSADSVLWCVLTVKLYFCINNGPTLCVMWKVLLSVMKAQTWWSTFSLLFCGVPNVFQLSVLVLSPFNHC